MVQLPPNRSPKLRSLSAHRRRRSLRPWCLSRVVSRLLRCSQNSWSHLPKQGRQVLQLQGWLTLRSCRKRCLPMPSWWKRLTRPSKSLWMKGQPTRTVKKWKQRWRIKWRLARSFRPLSSCQSCLQTNQFSKETHRWFLSSCPQSVLIFLWNGFPNFYDDHSSFPQFQNAEIPYMSIHSSGSGKCIPGELEAKESQGQSRPKGKEVSVAKMRLLRFGDTGSKACVFGVRCLATSTWAP